MKQTDELKLKMTIGYILICFVLSFAGVNTTLLGFLLLGMAIWAFTEQYITNLELRGRKRRI